MAVRRAIGLIQRLDDLNPDLCLLLVLFLSSIHILVFFLILAPLVLGFLADDEPIGDAADEEPPEQIDGLESCEEGEGNDLTETALVLLRFPVQFEGSNGGELRQDGPQNTQIRPVAHVKPDTHERKVIWPDNR